jgi:hypothetical protein
MSTTSDATKGPKQNPQVQEPESYIKLHERGLIVLGVALGVIGFCAGFHQGLFSQISFALPIAYGCGAAATAIALIFVGKLIYEIVQYKKSLQPQENNRDEKTTPVNYKAGTKREDAMRNDSNTQSSVISEPAAETSTRKLSDDAKGIDHDDLTNTTITSCKELFKNTTYPGWIMVPTRPELTEGKKQPQFALGSVGFKGEGVFKIHINVDPSQMEKAIEIVIAILLQADAPLCALKFQNQQQLNGAHQIGKEFALIFSEEAENSEKLNHAIEKQLSKIQNAFIEQSIRPEKGMILTAETASAISKLPDESLERKNLISKKYDRNISGSPYFNYRHEYGVVPDDAADGVTLIGNTDMEKIVTQERQFVHNPFKRTDPYAEINLNKINLNKQ